MRKKVFGRKFSRDYGSRQALLRALMRSLIMTGAINTSREKAKGVQPDIDALVNLAKVKSIASTRQAYAMLGNDRSTLDILTLNVAPTFTSRASGYTRIIPLPKRMGDASDMARLEWVEKVEVKTETKVAKGKKAKAKTEEKTEKKGVAKLLSRVKKADTKENKK